MKTKHVDLWYPRTHIHNREDNEAQAIQIGLMCVRAADDILVTYDYERDGYVISQRLAQAEDDRRDIDEFPWVERAFLSAWYEEED